MAPVSVKVVVPDAFEAVYVSELVGSVLTVVVDGLRESVGTLKVKVELAVWPIPSVALMVSVWAPCAEVGMAVTVTEPVVELIVAPL